MVRKVLVLAVAFAIGTFAAIAADDKKKDASKTVEGKLVCAKCTLKVDGIKKCTNAVKVKDGDKEVVYLLDDKGAGESYHKDICAANSEKDVKVTGTLSEKDGKKWLKDVKVEIKK